MSAISQKIKTMGLASLLKDLFVYLPQGIISKEIKTPDGVRLCLEGLSPVTKGRIKAGDAETPEREIMKNIPNNYPIIELGAGTGYLTTLMNKKTDKTHIAVEPNPNVVPVLKRTKELNNSNYCIVNKAYHPFKSEISFPNTKYFKTATFLDKHSDKVSVECTNLKRLFDEYHISDCLLHVDIEGAEGLLFENEMDFIRENCKGVFVEFHPWRLKNIEQYMSELCDCLSWWMRVVMLNYF